MKVYEIKLNDGIKFKVSIEDNKSQKQRLNLMIAKLKDKIESVVILEIGIHSLKQFENIVNLEG